jgi:subtilase family serine protease
VVLLPANVRDSAAKATAGMLAGLRLAVSGTDLALISFSLGASSGTGAAASLWGGLMALADQSAHHDLGSVNPAIYRIAGSSSYHQAFHNITTGSNIVNMPYPAAGVAGYQAGPGWNPVTGWGTPERG